MPVQPRPRAHAKTGAREHAVAEAQHLFVAAMDAMLIVDAQGQIQNANPAAGQLFETAPSALTGHRLDALLHGIKGSPAVWSSRGAKQLKHDGERMVELSVSAISVSGLDEYAVILHDITERKRYEAQLSSKANELEQKNEALERISEALQQANQQLETVNHELESFSYSVSHDLRAPLRGIDGFSRALLEKYADQLDPLGQHYLQRVRAGTQRMGQLIDDLLDLSRITRYVMRYGTVDLSAIADHIAQELAKVQPQREVVFLIQEDLQAQGDAHLLQIALQNLLANAWKFTSKRAQARIEFGAMQSPGEGVYFIRDNGSGFDMAYVDKLFGAFQRLHDETEFEGTGIGLATVQRIIRRHGGRIWAEGVVEQGASFYFTLADTR